MRNNSNNAGFRIAKLNNGYGGWDLCVQDTQTISCYYSGQIPKNKPYYAAAVVALSLAEKRNIKDVPVACDVAGFPLCDPHFDLQ